MNDTLAATDCKYHRASAYVGGQWITADSGGVSQVVNPATGLPLGTVPKCGRAETSRAIRAASDAFEDWSARTARERATVLLRIASAIERDAHELATLLVLEQGKPLAEAMAEIGSSAGFVRWFAAEAERVAGDVLASPWADRRILVTKEPVGVVGAITPWNFPSSMIARKLAPALAAGCTIVIKPAPQTPFSGLAWAVLCEEAGVPPGVVNVVPGDAVAIGAEPTTSPLVRKISFTGSTPVGKLLVAQSAGSLKKVSMELGGNAPFIVFDDADLDAAVEGALTAKYRNAGQTCICVNRFLVQDGIHDAFVARLAEAAAALPLGNGLDTGVRQGPLIDESAVCKVQGLVADAIGKGAHLIAGGHVHARGACFFEPTVLTDVTEDMAVAQEEIFGPVSAVFRFSTENEAVAIANGTASGLAAYFYSGDLHRAFRLSERLKFGMIGINEGSVSTEVAPFGGLKESGNGKEGSRYGIDDYLDVKYICLGGFRPAATPRSALPGRSVA